MAVPSRPNPTFENLGWELQPSDAELARLTILGRYPIRVRPELVEAVNAMHEVLIATEYENPCDYIGSWHYRAIAGTDGLASGHAYAVCIDLDYGGDTDGDGDPTIDKNPHLHRRIVPGDPGFGVEWQILEHQVRAIEAIRNIDGERIWRWLGWAIADTMHFEARVGPNDCIVDWDTVYPQPEPEPKPPEDDMAMPPLDVFVKAIRKVDIQKMGDDGIITSAEAEYFTGDDLWLNEHTKRDPNHPDWLNLYNAWWVRAPIQTI